MVGLGKLLGTDWTAPSVRIAALITAAVVLWGNVVNFLPREFHDLVYVPLNLLVALVLGLVAVRYLRLSASDLGLTRANLGRGTRYGLVAGICIPGPLLVAVAFDVSVVVELVADPQLEKVRVSWLLYATLVRIPLGTALFEEWVFRGVLFGLWQRKLGTLRALVASSIAFGLWHIVPTAQRATIIEPDASFEMLVVGALLGVLVTSLGGAMFVVLRVLGRGLLAPFLAHALINSLALVAAYLATQ